MEASIITNLGMRRENILISRNSTFRENLFYKVKLVFSRVKDDVDVHLQYLTDEKERTGKLGATIVYVQSIKDAYTIYEQLKHVFDNGRSIAVYHASLTQQERDDCLRRFQLDKIEVVIATIAFGMGIDKPNIRNVIMWGHPASIEALYQMGGRAGRDGKPSNVEVIADLGDVRNIMQIKTYDKSFQNDHESQLKQTMDMFHFCTNQQTCRHIQIARHFAEYKLRSDCRNVCDCCQQKYQQNFEKFEYVNQELKDEDLLKILKVVSARKLGNRMVVEILRGMQNAKVRKHQDILFRQEKVFGIGKHQKTNYWENLFVEAVTKKLIDVNVNVNLTEKYSVPTQFFEVTEEGQNFMHQMLKDNKSLEVDLKALYEVAQKLMFEGEENLVDAEINERIAKESPRNMYQLSGIYGVEMDLVNKLGPVIVECIQIHKTASVVATEFMEKKVIQRLEYLQQTHKLDRFFAQPGLLAWNLYSLYQDGKSVNECQDCGLPGLNFNITLQKLAEGVNTYGPSPKVDLQKLQKEAYLKDHMIHHGWLCIMLDHTWCLQ
eukprot:TRINITY_DN2206_c1_g1_i3.p1 TRINITY_DN2206_c1_g1~~TRINITY_DN2206_c1_g1_i3.p1  ORF type:complete len:548 (+),score=66.79 TRINITY_DN2206_c1_g1_i3:1198-2841(+)